LIWSLLPNYHCGKGFEELVANPACWLGSFIYWKIEQTYPQIIVLNFHFVDAPAHPFCAVSHLVMLIYISNGEFHALQLHDDPGFRGTL
jgi:hypothetical protein